MTLAVATALMVLTQGTPVDVAFHEMVAHENVAAIERIEANDSLERNDPARLINLGVAYAREGRTEEARRMFMLAASDEYGARLEMADGQWADSRDLARRALKMLAHGDFAAQSRVTMR